MEKVNMIMNAKIPLRDCRKKIETAKKNRRQKAESGERCEV
jgi:hypothetical protein